MKQPRSSLRPVPSPRESFDGNVDEALLSERSLARPRSLRILQVGVWLCAVGSVPSLFSAGCSGVVGSTGAGASSIVTTGGRDGDGGAQGSGGVGTGGDRGTGANQPGTGGASGAGLAGGGGTLGGEGGGTFAGPGDTVQGIFIPAAHPRLFWTAARLAQAKKWWTSHSFVPRTDQYSHQEQLFAYVMTGNASYCSAAITNAMAVDLSSCVPSKAGCDEARWSGENAILTYDWCYGQMTEAQRTTFRNNWNTWIKNIMAQVWGGPGMSQSNYYWGDVRDALEWGIASYQENKTAAEGFITEVLTKRLHDDFYPAALAVGKAAGGLGLEGGQYGPYQGQYVASILYPSVASSGRDLWTETPYWKGAVLNNIYMTLPRTTTTVSGLRSGWDVFPFDDDEDWQGGNPARGTSRGTFMMAAADRWGSSNIGQWAAQWLAMVQPTIDDAIESSVGSRVRLDWSSLPTEYYNAGPRYLVGRSNWTADATAYLWQMGDHYSDGHIHNDWGAFQINRKGRWLTRETAGYTESVAAYGGTGSQLLNTGFAHNVPFINGKPGNLSSSPVVHRLETRPSYVYADVDLTGAYSKDSVPVHVEREYWFVRDLETFVILDRLQTDTAVRSRTFVLHCETTPLMVDASHVDCVNGDQQLAVTTLLPAAAASRTVVDESKGVSDPPPKANTQYRVEINDMPNATAAYTLHVLQAMDKTGKRLTPTVTDSSPGTPTSGTLTVTLDGQHTLTIVKGMSSTGGTITIGGETTNLRADVQGFGLDADDRPVWSP